jgi:hypothetical protein
MQVRQAGGPAVKAATQMPGSVRQDPCNQYHVPESLSEEDYHHVERGESGILRFQDG